MKSLPTPFQLNRRSFLGMAGAATLGIASTPQAEARSAPGASAEASSTHLRLMRPPDRITAYAGLNNAMPLTHAAGKWQSKSIFVAVEPTPEGLPIKISSPAVELTHVHLRWQIAVDSSLLFLGDHWERSYGDLAWRSMVPERVLPWYFATWDGTALHAYGVRTGARTLCFWQADNQGVSLWLHLANGGSGVQLGERTLEAATIVVREGHGGEEPLTALRAFCSILSPAPRLPKEIVYGSNDWYYAYGKSSAELILGDADMMAELAPAHGPRPFVILDEGWEQGPPKFPDMARLAEEIRRRGSRPGIWVRPLRVAINTSPSLLMPAARFGERSRRAEELAYDPTIPEANERVAQQIEQLAAWGYELIKHDFSTYDLLGQWGFEMGAQPTLPGWSFHDRTRTNAEIITSLYQTIRKSAGEQTLILGCNVVGHLSAGIFEMQRSGDDTSGKDWERTRRMGVNTIAFRLPQHRTFFVQDPDCVALTRAVPWEQTRQWLDLVAQSGTTLIVSVEKSILGEEQKRALKAAFARAIAASPSMQPEDWFHSTTPEAWTSAASPSGASPGAARHYTWFGDEGAPPFSV